MANISFKNALSLFALLVVMAPAQSALAASPDKKYGKELVAEFAVPSEIIAKYASFQPSEPQKGESAIVNAMLADTVNWIGHQLDAETRKNPYTIVVTVLGTAKVDGDASSLWQYGWEIEHPMNGPEQRLFPLPGIGKSGVKAGDTMMITVAAMPTSFKENRSVRPVLGFVNARNLEINSVRVQVWSGMAGMSWVDILSAFRWALIPMIILGLMWWFRRS